MTGTRRFPRNHCGYRAKKRMLLTHHDLGGHGPTLLIIHANSLCGRVYAPLVDTVFSKHFHCIALDMPGQGDSPPLPPGVAMTVPVLVESVISSIRHFGLIGCRVFAHSLGGSIAMCVEHAYPGTFHAMYVYEAPCSTPTGWERECQAHPPSTPIPGVVLAGLARKRRGHWPSRQEASESLSQKMPFKAWSQTTLEDFFAHGLRPVATPTAAQPPSPPTTASTTPPQGGVELCCHPSIEEAVYKAFEPPPCIPKDGLSCPLAWAVTREQQGVHARLPMLGRSALNDLKTMQVHEFPHLSHFGPMESPSRVAEDVVNFFFCVDQGRWTPGGVRVVEQAWPEGLPQPKPRL